MNMFVDQPGIKRDSSGNPLLTSPERQALAKKAALTFDVNPVVARIRMDCLFPTETKSD
jgi:hypothetical protein